MIRRRKAKRQRCCQSGENEDVSGRHGGNQATYLYCFTLPKAKVFDVHQDNL